MLDTSTKKRIDDCRDILVGKLPDPKAQIEQITIGLIYKFMDDMDKEAIELGGVAKFFSGDFEKFSWDNLFDSKVTAIDMLTLYSEAIVSMDKNPNIPQLFRDIFKNAYLPYRDPETLKMFLKTIGEFQYTHSETLGDAFEYLLSVMGSQGDAGQFRTPRHIIDFLVAIVNPSKTDSILDPACGTAGFLISAFKHILAEADKNGNLTPEERKKLIRNFVGYDISPDMVRLSLVNLYLHGFSDPHIWEYDTLSSEERWDDTFDVILANPPFMSPKGGIRPHKRFSISSNRSEVLFVDYIAEHLNSKGRAGIIVPEGVIFQSGKAYKDLRKMLVENYLYAVVSLPAGVFNPYSGVKTSILLLDKELAKQGEEILFVKVDNDGYGLGAQRNAMKGGQLDEAIQAIANFKLGIANDSKIAHSVPKSEIAKNGDYNLSGERYKISKRQFENSNSEKLGNICNFKRGPFGGSLKKEIFVEEGYPIYEQSHAIYNQFKIFRYFISENKFKEMQGFEVRPRDLIMSCSGTMGKVAIVPNEAPIGIINQALLRLTPTGKISPFYLRLLMESEPFQTALNKTVMGVAIQNVASVKVLKELEIPLPSLSVQEEIVAEIEGYQKIIDGAKMVVEHYKPKIDIDPDWEMVELGEVCDVKSGGTPDRDNPHYWNGSIPYIKTGQIFFNRIYEADEYITQEGLDNSSARIIPAKTILMAMYGQGVTRGRIAILEIDAAINQAVSAILPNNDIINTTFLYFQLQGLYEFLRKISDARGGNQSNLNSKLIKELKISIPSFETQLHIVSRIEKEQELVSANKQLIEIFEQKIKDRIAKVWGE